MDNSEFSHVQPTLLNPFSRPKAYALAYAQLLLRSDEFATLTSCHDGTRPSNALRAGNQGARKVGKGFSPHFRACYTTIAERASPLWVAVLPVPSRSGSTQTCILAGLPFGFHGWTSRSNPQDGMAWKPDRWTSSWKFRWMDSRLTNNGDRTWCLCNASARLLSRGLVGRFLALWLISEAPGLFMLWLRWYHSKYGKNPSTNWSPKKVWQEA